jgi:ATP-dependent RNA helicase SUPV3L1/SUV3
VRFGAYHIYLPLLLKPAPRALATQLWALKHESPQAKGVDDLLHLAASGRTSIPIDKETPKPLYRTAGYRVCGERAVRVDILERLADLIRPALSWREGATGAKPAGAFDGKGFIVTGAMTSLTGASGEDFASILRSLGYRLERRAKPAAAEAAPPVAPTAAAAEVGTEPVAVESAVAEAIPVVTAPAEIAVAESVPAAAAPAETAPVEVVPAPPVSSLSLLPPTDLFPTSVPPAPIAMASVALPAVEPVTAEPAPPPAVESPAAPMAEAVPVMADAPAAAAAAASAEDAFIEVWRPGGRSDRRDHPKRPRPARRDRAAPAAPAVETPAVAAATAEAQPGGAIAAAAKPAAQPYRQRGPHRPRPDIADKRADKRPEPQARRPGQERGDPQSRRERPGRKDRGAPVDRAERDRYYAKPQGGNPRDRRDKEPDPNSPFAKLAALKQQLEANAKEGR